MSVKENLEHIQKDIPEGVQLIAVSKTKPLALIMEAYEAGHRDFGENRVQELMDKQEDLPEDIRWHLIGHLQRNKVKYIAPYVHLIHSVDSLKLLKEIDKRGKQNERVIDCLLQFHIASEETKYGLSTNEAEEMLESEAYAGMQNIRISGVMGMASLTDVESQVKREFGNLKRIFDMLRDKYFNEKDFFRNISMGMSGDYKIAIQEGSTMVRVGSAIFGDEINKFIW